LFGHGELPKVDASILPAARRGGFRKCDDGYKQIAVPPAPTFCSFHQASMWRTECSRVAA
jgi:hypothetical protein